MRYMFKGFSASGMKSIMVGVIIALITVVVVVQLVAGLVPTVLLAFGNLAALTGLYFYSFYAASGIMQIVFGAVILILIIAMLLMLIPGGQKGGKSM